VHPYNRPQQKGDIMPHDNARMAEAQRTVLLKQLEDKANRLTAELNEVTIKLIAAQEEIKKLNEKLNKKLTKDKPWVEQGEDGKKYEWHGNEYDGYTKSLKKDK
jgi:hypothetical protein